MDPRQCRLEVAHPALPLELHWVKMVTGVKFFSTAETAFHTFKINPLDKFTKKTF
jgi:hypothetical protein